MFRVVVFFVCVLAAVDARTVNRKDIFKKSIQASPMVRGVNLGGWLVMEPWITPSIFETVNRNIPGFNASSYKIVDEWTFWQYGGLATRVDYRELIADHWADWVSEDHFVTLANAGITHLRVPIGYWYFDVLPGEPWNNGTDLFPIALEHLVNASKWARNHNLKMILDLHTAPGSQNGFDNSGRRGGIHLLEGSNLARTERIIDKITRWGLSALGDVLDGVECLNEPNTFDSTVGTNMWNAMKTEYYPFSYANIRNASNSLKVVLQSAFKDLSAFRNYMPPEHGFQNVWIDDHNYQCFGDYNQWAYGKDGWGKHFDKTCSSGSYYASSPLWTVVGEFSLAVTDCTKWLLGIGNDPTPIRDGHPSTCAYYNANVSSFPQEYRDFLNGFARAQMDVFESANGWFFWNFRTENSPEWDFLLGLQQGWIPNPVTSRTPYCKTDTNSSSHQ